MCHDVYGLTWFWVAGALESSTAVPGGSDEGSRGKAAQLSGRQEPEAVREPAAQRGGHAMSAEVCPV